jgi:putative oxidoreductase
MPTRPTDRPTAPAALLPAAADRRAAYAALLLRVALGTMLIAHGSLKVFGFGLAGFAGFLGGLGYPAFFAHLVVLAELGGGLLLVLGVWTSWVSLLVLPILIGATLAHAGNGWLFTSPNGGWEFPAFWTAALVVQALLGDGAHALGRLVFPAAVPGLRPAAPVAAE